MKTFALFVSLLILSLICGCTVSEVRRVRSGPAFAKGEKLPSARSGKRYNSPEIIRSRRTRLPGHAETRHQQIIPARMEHFNGNPHLRNNAPAGNGR